MLVNIRLCSVIAIALFAISELSAQTPHGWRGPQRNGFYSETGLLKSWNSEGPTLLWSAADIGKGYSSPVVVDNRLYVTGLDNADEKEVLSVFALDGKMIHQVVYGSVTTASYPEARTTPSILGSMAYVVSGSGEVVCINTENGQIVWKVDGNTFGRRTGSWGTSESLLVFDDKVIYSPGGNQTTVVALNAQTGELVWKSRPLDEHSSYVSPLLINHNGHKSIIGVGGRSAYGINPVTGNIDWTFDDWGHNREGSERIAPNTPLFYDGHLLFSFGYDKGSFMLKLNDNATAVSLVWRNDDFDNHHGGYVLVDGIIYGANWINNGSGNWMAVDWKTGQTKYNYAWSGRSKGSIITADGLLYCYEERRGTVALVKPTPEKFDLISEFQITQGEGPHWAHPVINNGVLYIRRGPALMAYSIKN